MSLLIFIQSSILGPVPSSAPGNFSFTDNHQPGESTKFSGRLYLSIVIFSRKYQSPIHVIYNCIIRKFNITQSFGMHLSGSFVMLIKRSSRFPLHIHRSYPSIFAIPCSHLKTFLRLHHHINHALCQSWTNLILLHYQILRRGSFRP